VSVGRNREDKNTDEIGTAASFEKDAKGWDEYGDKDLKGEVMK